MSRKVALAIGLMLAALTGVFALVSPGPKLLAEGESPHFSGLAAFRDSVCQERPERVTPTFCSLDAREITFSTSDEQDLRFEVLVAANSIERAAGYQYIHPEVIGRSAIFFLYARDSISTFHMCNVRAPLDILWLRANGTVLDHARMEPASTPCRHVYAPTRFGSYRYALELPAGYLERLGLDARGIFAMRLAVEDWMQ